MSLVKPLLVLALGALLWPVGCSSQAEGQRCDTTNGNDDCESGLECIRVSELKGAKTSEGALCCPHDPLAATVEACLRVGVLPPSDGGTGGTPGDGSTGGTPGTDAGNKG